MSDERNLKVGFWLGHASLQHGGVGPYALRIFDSLLVNNEPGWRFIALCNKEALDNVCRITQDSNQIAEVRAIASPPDNRNTWQWQRHIQRIGARSKSKSNSSASASRRWNYLEKWVSTLNLDLIHFPMQTPPFPTAEHVPYAVPKLMDVPVPYVVTVHDVQELHFPEYFSPAQRAIRAMHQWKTLDCAGRVIVSFDHVKADLIKYFNLPENKIHVCPIPFNSISLQKPTPAAMQMYGERYAKLKPYLLYPAQTWRHKNHGLLFQALRRLQRQGQTNLRLVCTGAKNEYYPTLEAQLDELQLRDFVLFTDVVPEDELAWLYRHTAAVVIPTEYEAGSFPLFEAIIEGAPVICSNVTSLPEIIGDRRFVFDPRDDQALSEMILRIISDAGFREENIANSLRQADKLRRVNTAAYIYEAYRSLLGIRCEQ